jgi:hypothetical protein
MRRESCRLALGLAGLSAVLLAAPQQRPTFRSTANGVLLNAYVLPGARTSTKPVDGLTGGDFEVTDNGQTQAVEAIPAQGPIDLTLVVDASARAAFYAPQFRSIAGRLTASLGSADRIRLLVCGSVVREAVPLRPASAGLQLPPLGGPEAPFGSSMMHGLFDAMVREADPERRQVVVSLATLDGREVFGPSALQSVAASSDAVVYLVAEPGGPLYPGTIQSMEALVSATGGALFLYRRGGGRLGGVGNAVAVGFESAQDVTSVVLNDLRHGYVLSYSPPGGTTPGWHDIRVRIRKPGETTDIVRARKRYYASN